MGLGILIAVSLFLGILTYYLWIWTYWMRRGIKGPRGIPFVGVLDVMLDHDKPGLLKLGEWTKKYGKVFGYTDGTQKTLVVSDPAMVHEIFVKQFDNFYGRKLNPIQGNPEKDQRVHLLAAQGYRWKRLRTISSQSFSNSSLRRIMDTVEDSALELLRIIEDDTAEGKQIDMLKYYQEYTMDVIARVAMGQQESLLFHNPIIHIVREIFCKSRKGLMMICQIFPPIGQMIRDVTFKVPVIPAFQLYNIIKGVVTKRIEQRDLELEKGAELGEPQDFIDLFLNAKSDDVDFSEEAERDFSRQKLKITKVLSDDEVVGQCFLFLIGGFDTTALALSYVTYLLAIHPEIQKKVQEEVDREFGGDTEIEFDKLGKLKYMDCAIKEALRLYPLASISNSRKCMRTTTVRGVEIEEGTYVQMDTWTLHYDPLIWGEDVNEFKPERWTSDADHKGAYLPFGLGPRQCIGMRLAVVEQKVLLTHILRKYSFKTGNKTSIPLKLVGSATTSPKDVYVHLIPRVL